MGELAVQPLSRIAGIVKNLLAVAKAKWQARPLSAREKALVIAFLFLLAAALYYYLVMEKQLRKIGELKHQVEEQEMVLREMRRKGFHNLSELEDKINEYDRLIEAIYKVVPNIKDTPGLLVDLYQLVTRYGLVSDKVSFGQLKTHQNYSTFAVNLKVKGSPAGVKGFLNALEDYRRPLSVNKVEFTPTKEGELEAAVEVLVFVLHDISPDPLSYPFMDSMAGWENPFEMFKHPAPESPGEGNLGGAAGSTPTGAGGGQQVGGRAPGSSAPVSPAIPPFKQGVR